MEPIPPPPPPPPPQIPAGDPDVILPINPTDPVLALVLGLLLGGVAYFVIGQWQKGLAGVAAWLCAIVIVIITCGVGIVVYLPVVVAIGLDAYMQADELKRGHPIGQWTFFRTHL